MQNGWTAKNIESLRPYFTDALFTQMERSLQGYAQRGETNVVERIAVLDVTPLGFHQTGGEDHILLRLRTRITDYTVNDGTQQIVRSDRSQEEKVRNLRMGSAAPDRHADERRAKAKQAHPAPRARST